MSFALDPKSLLLFSNGPNSYYIFFHVIQPGQVWHRSLLKYSRLLKFFKFFQTKTTNFIIFNLSFMWWIKKTVVRSSEAYRNSCIIIKMFLTIKWKKQGKDPPPPLVNTFCSLNLLQPQMDHISITFANKGRFFSSIVLCKNILNENSLTDESALI